MSAVVAVFGSRRASPPYVVDLEDRDRPRGRLEIGELASIRGDHDPSPDRRDADVGGSGGQRLGARRCYRSDLDAAEHDLGPVRARSEDDEHAILRGHVVLSEIRRPASCAVGEVLERPRLDDTVPSDERVRLPPRVEREHLDDVTGEVEPAGDAPTSLGERGGERYVERARAFTGHGGASARAEDDGLHGTSVIGSMGRPADRSNE